MKRSPYILFFLSVFFLCCISFKAKAQIIPDSDTKLRTIKTKKKGRRIFAKSNDQIKERTGAGAYVLGKRLKNGKFTNHEFENNKIRSVTGHKNHFNVSDFSGVAHAFRKRLKYTEFENHEFEKNKIRSVTEEHRSHFNVSKLSWFNFDSFIKEQHWISFTGRALTDTAIKKSDQLGYSNSKNRDWNLFWVNLGPSTHTPEGIKEKVSPPKFDKKERKIWNN